MHCDPHREEASVDRRHRRAVGPFHPARHAEPRPVRQRPEFAAKAVREWIAAVGSQTAFIEPGSPWENGFCESFNARLRDELLNGEIFYTLAEAKIVIEGWRRNYNAVRPHSALGYRPPAPEVALWPAAQPRPAPPATPTVASAPFMN
jgi:transposase InsO family protein